MTVLEMSFTALSHWSIVSVKGKEAALLVFIALRSTVFTRLDTPIQVTAVLLHVVAIAAGHLALHAATTFTRTAQSKTKQTGVAMGEVLKE